MHQEPFLQALRQAPEGQTFQATQAFIDTAFHYRPTRFSNGPLVNEAGKNEGSCKIFAMALLLGLSESECLQCFGDYYRIDVLDNPQAKDHANIRQFIKTGYAGLQFDEPALRLRNSPESR
ncbi:HopJ type III effector protein [Simiduia agarivorans]|uniref:Type III effector HopPmaJ(Pto) n=1 Tax=Simiduia agarivorans (strain DSM 21679 / JCM 13881 / BCRC 17597 / SA1) TaxID=1117647 RepID=K4KY35_SIMAS|nr:HopJ type III effector protein [Simiduia agarivorans]AFU98852.1 type III effector HopPmaJ(Pto) [Simiduia agarivorans SA1 = DSM 21679]